MEPNSHLKLFLEVSALLTGFSKMELKSTGMLETYYNTIQKNMDKQDIDYFFLDVHVLLNDQSHQDIEDALASQFMAASSYNGFAANIIILWYTGNWGSEVVSSASYVQGLMWNAAHSHPPGAKQPGYGSWAERPLTVKNS